MAKRNVTIIQVLLKANQVTRNGLSYPEDTLKQMVKDYNSKPENEQNGVIFWDEKDKSMKVKVMLKEFYEK